MRRRVLQVLLIFAVLASPTVATAEDVNSEFGLLEVYTSIWNTHDGDALAALFTADADIIMGNLSRIAGREAIGGWW
jgi:hypothetical protein